MRKAGRLTELFGNLKTYVVPLLEIISKKSGSYSEPEALKVSYYDAVSFESF